MEHVLRLLLAPLALVAPQPTRSIASFAIPASGLNADWPAAPSAGLALPPGSVLCKARLGIVAEVVVEVGG